MKYLTALWQALMAFFSHLKHAERTEQATQQAAKDAQQTDTARNKADEEVRGASQRDRDSRLDRWMRD